MGQNIGDASGPCIRCGAATKVFSYDEAPDGFRGNYSWECPTCGRFYQADELYADGKVQYVFENDGRERVVKVKLPTPLPFVVLGSESCSCNYVKPCSVNCTCANSQASGGCLRCCSYGSTEQRKVAAASIAMAVAMYEATIAGKPIATKVLAEDDVRALVLALTAEEVRRLAEYALTLAPNVAAELKASEHLVKEKPSYDTYERQVLVRDQPNVVVGIDFASEPSSTSVVHGYIGPFGKIVLLDEPVSGPSVTQCLVCVAGGDEGKKVCEFRSDTGIEEGWYCEDCYKDWKNTPE